MDKAKRVQLLEKGIELTTGDRNNTYGDPFSNLTTYAELCQAYLRGQLRHNGYVALNSVDAAIFMVLAKVSRVAVNQQHEDNYVDMATYAAIAGECAIKENEEDIGL